MLTYRFCERPEPIPMIGARLLRHLPPREPHFGRTVQPSPESEAIIPVNLMLARTGQKK